MTHQCILRRASPRSANSQSGYALLLVVFFASLLLIGTMEIGLRTLTEGRREQEQEMIWRGKQYTRGIKMYYRKLGRFPNSVDDLVKPKIGNLRFMRQKYVDPMNKDDGSWRLIYVGPAGQLIGSLKPQNNNPLGGTGAFGQSGSTSAFGSSTSGGAFGTSPLTGQTPAPGSATTGFGFGTNNQNNSNPGILGAGTTATPAPGATPQTGTSADSQSIPSGDTPTIVGGNIIGVGSKINKASVIVYEQAENYRLFEFIWNPSKDLGIGAGGVPGGAPGQAAPGQGQPGQGVQPGFPGAPQQPPTSIPNGNPPNPNPNPNPQQ